MVLAMDNAQVDSNSQAFSKTLSPFPKAWSSYRLFPRLFASSKYLIFLDMPAIVIDMPAIVIDLLVFVIQVPFIQLRDLLVLLDCALPVIFSSPSFSCQYLPSSSPICCVTLEFISNTFFSFPHPSLSL